jgi:hypothetical protein
MGINDYKHGVRIPAGSSATYSNTPNASIASIASSVVVYNDTGPLNVGGICQLPVPEGALIRQFVMVGHCSKGRVDAEIGSVAWNVPRQFTSYAPLAILPTTPYEVPQNRQKKVVYNLPTAAPAALVLNRVNCYFIQMRFTSNEPVSLDDDLEVFYFEVYWD